MIIIIITSVVVVITTWTVCLNTNEKIQLSCVWFCDDFFFSLWIICFDRRTYDRWTIQNNVCLSDVRSDLLLHYCTIDVCSGTCCEAVDHVKLFFCLIFFFSSSERNEFDSTEYPYDGMHYDCDDKSNEANFTYTNYEVRHKRKSRIK